MNATDDLVTAARLSPNEAHRAIFVNIPSMQNAGWNGYEVGRVSEAALAKAMFAVVDWLRSCGYTTQEELLEDILEQHNIKRV